MLHLGLSPIRQKPSRSKKEASKEYENKKSILPTNTVHTDSNLLSRLPHRIAFTRYTALLMG